MVCWKQPDVPEEFTASYSGYRRLQVGDILRTFRTCLLWSGLASTGSLFYLTTVVCRFLPILCDPAGNDSTQNNYLHFSLFCPPIYARWLHRFLISFAVSEQNVSGCVLHVRPIPPSCFLKRLGCSGHTCEVVLVVLRHMKMWILTPAVLWTAHRAV